MNLQFNNGGLTTFLNVFIAKIPFSFVGIVETARSRERQTETETETEAERDRETEKKRPNS